MQKNGRANRINLRYWSANGETNRRTTRVPVALKPEQQHHGRTLAPQTVDFVPYKHGLHCAVLARSPSKKWLSPNNLSERKPTHYDFQKTRAPAGRPVALNKLPPDPHPNAFPK